MGNGSSSNKAHNILFGRGDDGEGPRTRHATLDMEKEIVAPSLSLSAPDQHHLGFRTRASAMSSVSRHPQGEFLPQVTVSAIGAVPR